MRLLGLPLLLACVVAAPAAEQEQQHSALTPLPRHASAVAHPVGWTPHGISNVSHAVKHPKDDEPEGDDPDEDEVPAVVEPQGQQSQAQQHSRQGQQDEDSMAESESEELAFAVFVFPIMAIFLGLGISWVLNRYLPAVPYTPVLLVFGFGVACLQTPKLFAHTHLQPSLEAWQHLSGHLILYVFIPPLIFGDAMQLDFHILKRCAGQCLLLAVPAVLFSTFVTAAVAVYILPYGWSWTLAIAFGAVLSATDPVAVVSLLKSLGASPALTMLIGGESLLNDGTAMVVFDIFFSAYMKEEQDFPRFLATIIFGSLAVGLLSGLLLLGALRMFSNKLKHYNSELQIALTIVAAYANFYFSEAVVGASGILSLVLMGCVCGYGFWPMIVNVEQMHGVWHTLEWLLNTLLFQLTGLIIGYKFMENKVSQHGQSATLVVPRLHGSPLHLLRARAWRPREARHSQGGLVSGTPSTSAARASPPPKDVRRLHRFLSLQVSAVDYCWAVLTYLCLVVIRFAGIFLLLPILSRTGYGMTWQGAVVAAWGGLRGALGLALALVMEAKLSHSNQVM